MLEGKQRAAGIHSAKTQNGDSPDAFDRNSAIDRVKQPGDNGDLQSEGEAPASESIHVLSSIAT